MTSPSVTSSIVFELSMSSSELRLVVASPRSVSSGWQESFRNEIAILSPKLALGSVLLRDDEVGEKESWSTNSARTTLKSPDTEPDVEWPIRPGAVLLRQMSGAPTWQ